MFRTEEYLIWVVVAMYVKKHGAIALRGAM
jgi:hypothetical protein